MPVQSFYIKDVLKTTKQYQHNNKQINKQEQEKNHKVVLYLLYNINTNSSGKWMGAGWLVQFSCL